MAGTRSKHNLDATFFNRAAVHPFIVLLFQLKQAMSCCHEVVNQLEAVHGELLSNGAPICRLPMRNVGGTYHVVLDLTSNSNDTNFGPIRCTTLVPLKELCESIGEVRAAL